MRGLVTRGSVVQPRWWCAEHENLESFNKGENLTGAKLKKIGLREDICGKRFFEFNQEESPTLLLLSFSNYYLIRECMM